MSKALFGTRKGSLYPPYPPQKPGDKGKPKRSSRLCENFSAWEPTRKLSFIAFQQEKSAPGLHTPVFLPYLCITKTEKHNALRHLVKRFGSSVG
jgi:hypothetical protein